MAQTLPIKLVVIGDGIISFFLLNPHLNIIFKVPLEKLVFLSLMPTINSQSNTFPLYEHRSFVSFLTKGGV